MTNISPVSLELVKYQTSDTAGIISLFEGVQECNHGVYPPRGRTNALGGIEAWLSLSRASQCYAAKWAEGLVGFVEIEDLANVFGAADEAGGQRCDYWHRAFLQQAGFIELGVSLTQMMVIKRLAVDPIHRRQGIGRMLLQHAIEVIRNEHTKIPALVALEQLADATRLYEAEGAKRIGGFTGYSGGTMSSYIFTG